MLAPPIQLFLQASEDELQESSISTLLQNRIGCHGPYWRVSDVGIPLWPPLPHPDGARQQTIGLLVLEIVQELKASVIAIAFNDIHHLVDDVPMPKSGSITVPRADLFPGVIEGIIGRVHARKVQSCNVLQEGPPTGLSPLE